MLTLVSFKTIKKSHKKTKNNNKIFVDEIKKKNFKKKKPSKPG